jgi:NAD(P)H-hydrate epimerase
MRTVRRDAVRDLDRRAVEEYGLPGVVLMENAGRGAAELLVRLGAGPGGVLVCSARGNNGGDGFVIARHLDIRGVTVRVLLFADPATLSGDAAVNYRVIAKAGLPVEAVTDWPAALAAVRSHTGWVVDALFGTGLRGALGAPYDTVIAAMNDSPARVLAVDLPSGLDCDTGEPLGPVVRADATATFVAAKYGFANPASVAYTGEVHVIDIGAPRSLVEAVLRGEG